MKMAIEGVHPGIGFIYKPSKPLIRTIDMIN